MTRNLDPNRRPDGHVRLIERRVRVVWALLFLALLFAGTFCYVCSHRRVEMQARSGR